MTVEIPVDGANAPIETLSLFSGIGGIDLGLERSGYFRTVAFCEQDGRCQQLLSSKWPGIPIYDDVRNLTADRLSADGIIRPRAICGGFPCQDISEANVKGAALDGARSGLWREYARLICELRPEYVVVENVSALLGRGVDRVLGDLAAIGYDAEWHCIPASALGAPHVRDRIWIVAYPHSRQRWPIIGGGDLAWAKRVFPCRAQDAGGPAGLFEAGWLQDWRAVADTIFRVDDGLPGRLDGYNALANAVIPQIPQMIGRAIGRALNSREHGP